MGHRDLLVTQNLSDSKHHSCRPHPRGSVRRASGFVLTGKPEIIETFSPSCWPTNQGSALLWFALQRLANRDQENGTLVFCLRGTEVNHIVVEESQPGRAQVLSIRS